MPRALRIEYPGAVYHLMARGQRGDLIYRNDQDRVDFLELLGQACCRYGWKVTAYVLMGNHYHLLLETSDANLGQGMHWLQTSFGTRHRLRHGLSGSVFGGRYKALLIERDGHHLGTVLEYIHLNPWRAGLATLSEGLETWRWSSLPTYLAPLRARPDWLDVAGVLAWQGFADTAAGRRKYLKSLEERAAGGTRQDDESQEVETDWTAQLRRGWCFGSEGFREAMLKLAGKKLAALEDTSGVDAEIKREVAENRATKMIKQGCRRLRMDEATLKLRAKGDPQKVVLGWWVREKYAVSLGWLAERLNLGVPAAACRLLGRMKKPQHLTKQEKQWIKTLKESLI